MHSNPMQNDTPDFLTATQMERFPDTYELIKLKTDKKPRILQ